MPVEHTSVRAVRKPWGVSDLQPWSSIDGTVDAVDQAFGAFQHAMQNPFSRRHFPQHIHMNAAVAV